MLYTTFIHLFPFSICSQEEGTTVRVGEDVRLFGGIPCLWRSFPFVPHLRNVQQQLLYDKWLTLKEKIQSGLSREMLDRQKGKLCSRIPTVLLNIKLRDWSLQAEGRREGRKAGKKAGGGEASQFSAVL